jgi:hypothetical protein
MLYRSERPGLGISLNDDVGQKCRESEEEQ